MYLFEYVIPYTLIVVIVRAMGYTGEKAGGGGRKESRDAKDSGYWVSGL